MRIYMGGTTRPKLRKARQLAPSHCFGVTWTPSDRRLNEIPFFVDNGAFTSSFDPDEWVDLLDKLEDYNYGPDFVVLPDEYNDAKGTMARHREWARWRDTGNGRRKSLIADCRRQLSFNQGCRLTLRYD